MELGEKLRQARLEAGLSQRQLCGGEITRNMLSQIEHGTAKPSMKTLLYLAERLEKPVGYFLEEDVHSVPGKKLPEGMMLLERAAAALQEGKYPYAARLLEKAEEMAEDPLWEGVGCERCRLLLLSRLPGADKAALCAALPSLDEELLLRAEAAVERGAVDRALRLLDAAEDRDAPGWKLLRGTCLVALGSYADAVSPLTEAEPELPRQVYPLLEICFREMGDFQRAYHYACKQK